MSKNYQPCHLLIGTHQVANLIKITAKIKSDRLFLIDMTYFFESNASC